MRLNRGRRIANAVNDARIEERCRDMEETERRKGVCLRYGSVLVAAILATLLRMWLDPLLGDQVPFTTYFAAIMFVAWYAGLGPSLMAIVLSVLLGSYFFLEPRGSLAIHDLEHQVSVGLFVAVGLFIALLTELRRREIARRKRAEEWRGRPPRN